MIPIVGSPTISVIMPTYNSALFVEASVRSVLAQTRSNLELLLIDDGSTDGTDEVTARLAAEDSRIKLLRTPSNGGAAEARNVGIMAARGRYIAFCDSDDLWNPHKLARQIALMERNGWAFTYTAYDKIDEAGRPLGHVGVPATVSYDELLKTCVIGCLTAVYDTKVTGKVLMPLIRKRQDFGLWLRLLKKTPRAYGIRETLATYRVRTGSISANKASAARYVWRLYREVEGLSLGRAAYVFVHYAVRGVLRSRFPRLARRLGVLHVTIDPAA